MLIGVPRELLESENRVAATPKTVQQILKLGFDVIVEHDAGLKTKHLSTPAQKLAQVQKCGIRM